MSEQKRYTEQEMRAVGLKIDESPTLRLDFNDKSLVVAMLRQAAEAEEENAKLREENAKLTNIINTECNKCGDCAKFGNDCTAGDVDGNEDFRSCDKFVPKELAQLKARLETVAEGGES